MKSSSNITSVETKTGFYESQVETFVKINLPPRIKKENKLSGMGIFSVSYNDIEGCAAELPVNSLVEILLTAVNTGAVKLINCPVVSRFIVFCTREENKDYKVAWSNSLS